jgi:hypothetical protein
MSSSFPNIHQEPEPWRDPELFPKKLTTNDVTVADCTVEYAPEPPAKTWTTHDMVTASVTVEAPRNKIGDSQKFSREEWLFDGKKWFPAKDWNK